MSKNPDTQPEVNHGPTREGSPRLPFTLQKKCHETAARAAVFETLHGVVETPVFMPVGTQAAIKGQDLREVEAMGFPVLLANTYHLLLRPGPEVFRHFGGIHGFNQWPRSVLTDSGGFQIFSLPGWRKITEDGALFRSHHDDLEISLSPEKSIEMQRAIGSDIMMVLDVCVPATAEYPLAKEAMEQTHRWALRSLEARGDSPQALFGIVQGACHRELRRASAEFLTAHPFDGFAIGGLAVGETREQREEFTAFTASLLPEDRPRYLMGVGTPLDLLEAVSRGVDMFDCILPTALAQQGIAFTSLGRVELRRGIYRLSHEKLDPACDCSTCKIYSRGYLHHLIRTKEIYGWQLVGAHNLWYYRQLMKRMRQAILEGTFPDLYRSLKPVLESKDLENPVTQPKRNRSSQEKRKRGQEIPLGGVGRSLGEFRIYRSLQGHCSIQHEASEEVMHSVSDPIQEARALYLGQADLETRLQMAKKQQKSLVVWDVGLGAATNAMALLEEAEKLLGCRQAQRAEPLEGDGSSLKPRVLEILSFEKDLDALRLALSASHSFQYLWHPAPQALLENGEWVSSDGQIRWRCVVGDFVQTLQSSELILPELVFYDPFSPRTDRPLWSEKFFGDLSERLGGVAAEFITYSASNAVRARMLAAGFWVARGIPTPPKSETTRFFTQAAALKLRGSGSLLSEGVMRPEFLDADWLATWERSAARSEVSDPGLERVANHPQFATGQSKK